MTPTPKQLSAALDLIETWAKEATPGPWAWVELYGEWSLEGKTRTVLIGEGHDTVNVCATPEDRRHIARMSPDLLLWLVGHFRRLLMDHAGVRNTSPEYAEVAAFCQQLGALQ